MAKIIFEMKKIPKNYLLVAAVIILAIASYFGAFAIGDYYYSHYGSFKPSTAWQNQYKEKIAEGTNAVKAGKMGMVFLKTGYNDLAYLAFDRATTLDAGWRDAWIWKGYTELKMDKPKDALISLKNAETIDPVYPFTYQLLRQTYELLGNTREADAAKEKLSYLTKNK
jgi:predicted Zn-dependent protease